MQGPPPPPVDRGLGRRWRRLGRPRRLPPRVLHRTVRAAGGQHHVLRGASPAPSWCAAGSRDDWVSMPHAADSVLVNTAVLLASSVVLELARRALKAGEREQLQPAGGPSPPRSAFCFSGGQALAWQQLNAAGIFICHQSEQFVLLCADRGARVPPAGRRLRAALRRCAGAAAAARARPSAPRSTSRAIYWHFLDGLWIYLMVLFYVWG